MGDRANIFVKTDESSGVFLYTHWQGYALPQILKNALVRGESRWNDKSYLARIIFCEMIQNDVMGTTGYGISTTMPDNEHPTIVVDPGRQIVFFTGEGFKSVFGEMTFRQYIELSEPDYPEVNWR